MRDFLKKRIAVISPIDLTITRYVTIVSAFIPLIIINFSFAQVSPVGQNFLVNLNKNYHQVTSNRSIAYDNSGNFVIAWNSEGDDGSNLCVMARLFNSTGEPTGDPFIVNTYTQSIQVDPSVAMDASGNFTITWYSQDQDGDSHGVFAQRYNKSGVPQGEEFPVNTNTYRTQSAPSIGMDDSGNFVIAWNTFGNPSIGGEIHAQLFDSEGRRRGEEFTVNTYTYGDQTSPAVSMDADGDFAIAYNTSLEIGPAAMGILAQRFDKNGNKQGSEFFVNEFANSQTLLSSSMDSEGNYVVAWLADPDELYDFTIYARIFYADGSSSPKLEVYHDKSSLQILKPSVAMDAFGNFAVVWQTSTSDLVTGQIRARYYNKSGIAQGEDFLVYSDTAKYWRDPTIAINDNHKFIIAWSERTRENGFFNIYTQRFQVEPVTGIDQTSNKQFNIFPNPTSEKISIQVPTSFGNIANVQIFNSFQQLVVISSDISSIDLSSFNPGLYFIKVKNEHGEQLVTRIVKE